MDFTQMPVSLFISMYDKIHYKLKKKYLLVMIDIFTGWIEGFPTWTEKAEEVVKKKTAP